MSIQLPNLGVCEQVVFLSIDPQIYDEKGHSKNRYRMLSSLWPHKKQVELVHILHLDNLSVVLNLFKQASHEMKKNYGMCPLNQISLLHVTSVRGSSKASKANFKVNFPEYEGFLTTVFLGIRKGFNFIKTVPN